MEKWMIDIMRVRGVNHLYDSPDYVLLVLIKRWTPKINQKYVDNLEVIDGSNRIRIKQNEQWTMNTFGHFNHPNKYNHTIND